MTRELGARLLDRLSWPLAERPLDLEALERKIQAFMQEGQLAWPGVVIDPLALVDFLAKRLSDDQDPGDELNSLNASGLYLAAACAAGSSEAIAAFEQQIFPVVDLALHRLRIPSEMAEDVKQELRLKLFVTDDASKQLICNYQGWGALHRWLKVIAVRTAGRMLGQLREVPIGADHLEELISPVEDLELMQVKLASKEAFRNALQQAFSEITDRQHRLLRYRYLDRYSNEVMCRLFQVHRGTIARWLHAARQSLLDSTRQHLGKQLELTPSGFDSLMRIVDSQLDMSVADMLKKTLP